MVVSSAIANILANLSGYLVRHRLAHLPCNIMAGLSWDLKGNLARNLVALFPWHRGTLLLGHAVTFLLWNIVTDGLWDSPGGVDTLGLWDLSAPWARNQAGLLDWPIVADTPDLGLAPWCSMCNGGNSCGNGGNDVLGISLWLSISPTFGKWMTKSPHSSESSKSGITRGSKAS